MTTTTYVNANLHHDQVIGRTVTACLHIVVATASHWHTKSQSTVETATLGSEFVAARIATDQIIDHRYTLMYLGVPVRSKNYMFGDYKSIVDSASILTLTMSKRSTLASYHKSQRSHCCRISPIHLERWNIQPCRCFPQTLGVHKHLASSEAPTLLEERHT